MKVSRWDFDTGFPIRTDQPGAFYPASSFCALAARINSHIFISQRVGAQTALTSSIQDVDTGENIPSSVKLSAEV